eukprot:7632500-Heterocapsa_arctica.AAC.1
MPSSRPSSAPRTAPRVKPAALPHSKPSRPRPLKTSGDASTHWNSCFASPGTSCPSLPRKPKGNTETSGYFPGATLPSPS